MPRRSKSQEIAPRASAQPPGTDEYRWLRAKHGRIPIDQIAADDGVSAATVQKSIRIVERNRARLTLNEVQATEMDVLLAGVRAEAQAINGALVATKRVQLLDSAGRPVIGADKAPLYQVVPDHETRLAAVKTRTDILNAISPKGTGLKVQMNQVSAPGRSQPDGRAGAVQFRSVEDRIIEFNRRRERLLTSGPVVEAEVTDDEGDDEGEVEDEGL